MTPSKKEEEALDKEQEAKAREAERREAQEKTDDSLASERKTGEKKVESKPSGQEVGDEPEELGKEPTLEEQRLGTEAVESDDEELLDMHKQQVKDAEETDEIAPPDYIPGEGMGQSPSGFAPAPGVEG